MKIGVSGASGKLGRIVLTELAARNAGHELVGISRTPEAVMSPAVGRRGDYDLPETLVEAYSGLDRLLLIPSAGMVPGVRGRQFVTAIDAAVKAGVGHIVLMSAAGTHEVPATSLFEAYWKGEQHLMKIAPRWTILRMNYYSEAISLLDQGVQATGIAVGLGEDRIAFVSRDDVGAAAAAILVGEGHAGAIYNATGPESVTGEQRAAFLSEITGKSVRFVTSGEQQFRDNLGRAGLPLPVIEVVIDLKATIAAGAFDVVSGDVQRLSGRRPKALREAITSLQG